MKSETAGIPLLQTLSAKGEIVYQRLGMVFESDTWLPYTIAVRVIICGFAIYNLASEGLAPALASLQTLLPAIFVGYALYLIGLVVLYFRYRKWFVSRVSERLQVLLDVLFFGAFYWLSGNPEADIAYAFLLPVLIAARYFTIPVGLGAYALVVGVFAFVLGQLMVVHAPLSSGHVFEQILAVRALLFAIVGLVVGRVSRLKNALDQKVDRLARLEEFSRKRLELMTLQSTDPAKPRQTDLLLEQVTRLVGQELHAETSAVFLLQQGRFCRRKIYPQKDEWFHDESYAVGQGVTGKIGLALDENQAGQAILDNDAANNRDMLGDNVQRYAAELPARRLAHFLGVPLTGPEGTFGSLRVMNKESRPGVLDERGFTADDKDLLSSLALLVAVQYGAMRSASEMQGYSTQVKAMAELLRDMMKEEDTDRLYRLVADRTAQILYAEDCTIFRIDRETEELRMVASRCIPNYMFNRKVTKPSPEPGAGIPSVVAATARPVIFPEVKGQSLHEIPAWQGKFLEHLNYLPSRESRSLMAYPIVNELGQVLGVIKVENRTGVPAGQGFRTNEGDLLGLAASQLSTAIQKIERFQKLQDINLVAQQIVEANAPRRTLEILTETAARVVPADVILLLPYDHVQQRLLIDDVVHYGKISSVPTSEVPRPHGTTNWVLNSQRGYIVIPDMSKKPDHQSEFIRSEGIQSVLGVRIEFSGQALGVAYFDNRNVHEFSPAEIEYAQTFARLAAIALYNQRTYRTLQALLRLTDESLRLKEPRQLIRFILGEILHQLGYDFATISLVNDSDRTIECADGIGQYVTPEWIQMAKHSLDSDDIQALVVARNETMIPEPDDPHFDIDMHNRFGHEKLIRVFTPLRGRERVIGTIEAGYERELHPSISKLEVQILEKYASQVGLVIEGLLSTKHAQAHATQLEELLAFSEQMLQAIPEEGLSGELTLVANMAETTAGAGSFVVIHSHNEDKEYTILSHSAPADILETDFFVSDEFHQVMELGKEFAPTVHHPDLPTLCLPMTTGSQQPGTLAIFSNHPKYLSEEDKTTLRLFAAQAAIAVNLASGHQKIRSDLEVVTFGLTDLLHQGPGRPVNQIVGGLENLADGLGELNDRQRECVIRNLSVANKLQQEIKNLTLVKQLDEKRVRLNLEDFSLSASLRKAVDSLRNRFAQRQIQLQLDVSRLLDDSFHGDEDKLREKVWVELLSNALRFTERGGTVLVTADQDGANVYVRIQDSGRGIPPTSCDRIFERGYQEPPYLPGHLAGDGNGLYIAKNMVEKHHGAIRAESDGQHGASFTVVLPRI